MVQNSLLSEIVESIQLLSRVTAHSQVESLARGEAYLLAYLNKHGGESRPCDLCEDMDVSKARISAALSMLEEKKYITRVHDDVDKRRIRICLTQAGEQYLLERRQKAYEKLNSILDKMRKEELEEYVRLTRKMISIANEQQNRQEDNG